MDTKLARGYTRAGLRRNRQRANDQLGVVVASWMANSRRLDAGRLMRLKITEADFQSEWRGSPDQLYYRRLKLPLRKNCVGTVSANLEFAEANVNGHPAEILHYIRTISVAEEQTAEVRVEWGKLFVHSHAAARFIERTNKEFCDLAFELGQAVGLSSLFEEVSQWVSRQVVFPLASGLLLGECRPEGTVPLSHMHIGIDRYGHPHTAYHQFTRPTCCGLITFIAHDQMTDGQAAVWNALRGILDKYGDAIFSHHITGLCTFDGQFPELKLPVDEEALNCARLTFHRLIRSETWREAVRFPKGHSAIAGWKLVDMFTHAIPAMTSPQAVLCRTTGHRWRTEWGFLYFIEPIEANRPKLVGDLAEGILAISVGK